MKNRAELQCLMAIHEICWGYLGNVLGMYEGNILTIFGTITETETQSLVSIQNEREIMGTT